MNNSFICFNQILKSICIKICLLNIINIFLNIINAELISRIITNATNGEMQNVIKNGVILIGILIIFRAFSAFFMNNNQKKAEKLKHKCKMILYKNFLNQPLNKLYNAKNGEIMEKFNDDFNTVVSISLSLFPNLFIGLFTIIIYLLYFLNKSIISAFTLIIISLIQVIPPIIVKKYMEKIYKENRDIEAKVTNWIISGYNGLSVIKMFNLKEWYIDQLKVFNQKAKKIAISHQIAFQSETSIEHMIESILKYGTYGILGLFVLNKYISLENGVSIVALSTVFYASVQSIFSLWPEFGVAKVAQKRLDSWFVEKIYEEPAEYNNEIVIEGVSIEFNEKDILRDISKSIDLDKITLIGGANGSGKSTLVKCLMALVQPTSGNIFIDRVNIENLSSEYYRNRIVYLDQNDPLFKISPLEFFELAMGNNLEECIDNAIDFGLNKKLLKSSCISKLSGGERKKIFLSVAFAASDKILVLDEPTNTLDNVSKCVFMEKLKQRGKGVIMITHDDELRNLADEIFFFNGGIINSEQI